MSVRCPLRKRVQAHAFEPAACKLASLAEASSAAAAVHARTDVLQPSLPSHMQLPQRCMVVSSRQ